MYPICFDRFGITLPTYGVLHLLAYALGVWLAVTLAAKEQMDRRKVTELAVISLLVAVLASRFINVALTSGGVKELLSSGTLHNAGGYYYGLVPGMLFATAYMRFERLPVMKVMDAFSPSLVLGLSICRLGCFASGCCYGRPTSSPFGVTFTSTFAHQLSQVPLHVALHPTQLYESATSAVILTVLLLAWSRRHFSGEVFAGMLLLTSTARFVIEMFRGDPNRGLIAGWPVSIPQLVAGGLFMTGAVVLVLFKCTPAFNFGERSKTVFDGPVTHLQPKV